MLLSSRALTYEISDILKGKRVAVIDSLDETAKANGLNVYQYFKHLLTEMPKHMDEKDMSFCEDLLPWSRSLPPECQKNRYAK